MGQRLYFIHSADTVESTEIGNGMRYERKIPIFVFVTFKYVQNPKDKNQPKQQVTSPNLI